MCKYREHLSDGSVSVIRTEMSTVPSQSLEPIWGSVMGWWCSQYFASNQTGVCVVLRAWHKKCYCVVHISSWSPCSFFTWYQESLCIPALRALLLNFGVKLSSRYAQDYRFHPKNIDARKLAAPGGTSHSILVVTGESDNIDFVCFFKTQFKCCVSLACTTSCKAWFQF